MPTLILLRHAKSDWPANTADLDRPLSERGRRDCSAVADVIQSLESSIDDVVVSPALRTRETANLVLAHLGLHVAPEIESRIYEAPVSNLLEVVSGLTSETVLLVGHNPGIAHLALVLCSDIESSYAKEIRHKYPTAGLTVLRSDFPWDQWCSGSAELEYFGVPRANPGDTDSD